MARLFALVAEGIAAATEALLSGDVDAAKALREQDKEIDVLYVELEEFVQRELALQAPMARDLRFLLGVLRVVPELERSHDLAVHIGRRATRGITADLTPRIRGLVSEMGRVTVEMWQEVGAAFVERTAGAAADIEERDDEVDELHVSLTAELASGALGFASAIEMVLVARFYERLGDHAVNIARRVEGMVGTVDAPMAPPPEAASTD